MSEPLLLGIDIGTTGCKVGLFDRHGNKLATATGEYKTSSPSPGWAEQDPEDWWRAAQSGMAQVFAQARVAAEAVKAVGLSNMSTTVLPVDKQGRPLRKAIVWPDTRAQEECGWLKTTVGEAVVNAIISNPITTFYGITKMLWLKKHEPEILRNTHKFLQASGYICFKLTGKFSINMADIEMTGFGDAPSRAWSDKLCELTGIAREKLPEIYKCYDVVGEIPAAVARETGLRAGTPVVAGAVDISAAALAAGVLRAGQAFIDAGHATNLAICVDKPVFHPGLIFFGSVFPNLWLIEGASGYTGASVRWFRDALGGEESDCAGRMGMEPFELLSLRAEKAAPGSGGVIFLPYLGGALCPIWDADARGVFFGLGLTTRKEEMIRSVMEGCAFDLLLNMRAVEELGVEVRDMVITGGGAKSRIWNRIRADILGKPLRVIRGSEGSVLGAALLAGMGAQVFPDVERVVEGLSLVREELAPDAAAHARYRKYYGIYERIYRSLQQDFKALAELEREVVPS
ncbi:MAG: xylulokinase [Patescibacteria group bacterium]